MCTSLSLHPLFAVQVPRKHEALPGVFGVPTGCVESLVVRDVLRA